MLADISLGSIGGTTAIVAAVIPILLGGVTTYFKIFLVSKRDFRNRTQLKRSDLRERVATKLAVLLQHIRSLGPDDPLRGDGCENVDLVSDYTEENFRVFTIYRCLNSLEGTINRSYFSLYITIVLGLLGVFLAWLLPITSRWVLVGSIILIVSQIVTVFVVQLAARRLDDYEDIT